MISAQTKKAGAAFAGAVVLASGAYAIGSQNDDGSATANQGSGPAAAPGGYGMPGNPPSRGQMRRQFREHRTEMLSDLAKKMGVKEADLRKALREIREQQRKEFTKLLADKLGVSESKVEESLPDRPKLGKGHRGFGGPPPGAPPPPAGP